MSNPRKKFHRRVNPADRRTSGLRFTTRIIPPVPDEPEAPFLCADTEDNSKELTEATGDGTTGRQVTQIAAIARDGTRFWSGGPKGANIPGFLAWLERQGPDTICYFHNLQYDLGNLFGEALDGLDLTLVHSRLIKARWKNITFLDSFNIWPMSLKKLGDTFGLVKLHFNANDKEYVFRDVEIVRKAMLFAHEFVKDYGLEKVPPTLGGLCVKIWQAMDGAGWPCTDDFAREGYYGGRVELYATGGTGCFAYTDINSLYPYVMTMDFPDEWVELTDWKKGWGIAEVEIKIPRCHIAPLPVRRDDGAIYYPWGTVRGVWTLHEIREAVKHGAKVLELVRCFGSLTARPYYKEFVLKHYALRRDETDPGKKLMFKLLMNNLYGRLGTGGVISRTLKLREDDFAYDGTYVGGGICFGKKHLIDVKMPLPEYVNWFHAAYVTAYARLELAKYLRMIPADKLVYCDTDSVIFWHEGREKPLPFPVGKELGQMKLEGFAGRCYTVQPKMYLFGHHIKVKGVPKRRQRSQGRTWNPAVEFYRNGSTEFFQPFKLRESVRFYDAGTRPASHWRRVEKAVRSRYDRKLLKDGYYRPRKHAL